MSVYPGVCGGYGIPGPAGPAGPAGTTVQAGGIFTIPAVDDSVAADQELLVAADGTLTEVSVVGGRITPIDAGVWTVAGSITVTSPSVTSYSSLVRIWLAWTEEGVARTSPPQEVTIQIGLSLGAVPVSFCESVLADGAVPIRIWANVAEDSGDVPVIAGRVGVGRAFKSPSE